MAEESTENTQNESLKDKLPRFKAEWAWFAIPGLLVVLFFAWTLFQMGGQSSGATLVRMLLGIAIVLLGGGAVTLLLGRSRKSPFNEDE